MTQAVRPVLALARPYLLRLVGAGLLAAAAELTGLGLLATASWLLVSAAGQPPLAALTVAIVSVRAFAIGRGSLRYAERLTGHDAVLRILAAVRERLYAGLVAGRRAAGGRDGDLLSRMVSDVEAVQELLLRVLVPVGVAAAVAAAALIGAPVVAPSAAVPLLVVIGAGLLLAGVGLPVAAVVTTDRTARRLAPLRANLATETVDLTRGAADLAAYGALAAATGRLRAAAAQLASVEGRLAATGAGLQAAGMLLAGLTAAGTIAVAVRGGANGPAVAVVGVGTLVAVESCLALLGAARRWAELRAPLTRIAALLEDPPAPTTAPERVSEPPAGPVVLRAQSLWAVHSGRPEPAVAGVDLELGPGARVAVVGPSGAGKSTLLAVLAGLHPVHRGTLTVAGAPLAAYPEALRCRLIGGLFADAHVFHASVRDNLRIGQPGASEAALRAACATAGLTDWLAAQPAGLDTVVGEDGAQLSGGERQRLALARAVLAAPAVLLLDEPTEGLAPEAADRVLAGVLAAAGPDRAVLLVTHQLLSLVRLAERTEPQEPVGFDEVLVLAGGRVIQRGTPAALAATPGWFRDQYQAQLLAAEGRAALAATS
ncbi:MAG TPA: thiol reductant ABC exporter subunit CydC [Natronosporangium sp.]